MKKPCGRVERSAGGIALSALVLVSCQAEGAGLYSNTRESPPDSDGVAEPEASLTSVDREPDEAEGPIAGGSVHGEGEGRAPSAPSTPSMPSTPSTPSGAGAGEVGAPVSRGPSEPAVPPVFGAG